MKATGVRMSVSMAESITASVTSARATKADVGTTDHFFYNRSVNNVNVTNIHNVYNTTVINNTTVNRVSYNGGNGGINARPRPEEEAAARERHIPPVAAQTQHVQAARANPELRASVNQGKPPVAATPKPGEFNGRAVVPAKEAGAPYNPPANRGAGQPPDNAPARASGEQRSSASRCQSTPRTFNRTNALLLRTQGTRSWTRSTSNSRTSCTRSRNRTTRNSSRSRNRNTSGWRNRTQMKRESSRSSRSTSNRRSKWSKNTHSSSSSCSSKQQPASPNQSKPKGKP